jgi:hypothetical protein
MEAIMTGTDEQDEGKKMTSARPQRSEDRVHRLL